MYDEGDGIKDMIHNMTGNVTVHNKQKDLHSQHINEEMIYHVLGLAEQRNELAAAHINQRRRRTDAHEAVVRGNSIPDAIELGKSEIRVIIKLLRGLAVCGEGLRRFIRVFMRVVDRVGAHSEDSLCARVRDALRTHVEA